jgi:hypothetical protein
LTNVFMIPFVALRARPEALEPTPAAALTAGAAGAGVNGGANLKLRPRKVPEPGSQQLPGWAPLVGAAGGFLGKGGRAGAGGKGCLLTVL